MPITNRTPRQRGVHEPRSRPLARPSSSPARPRDSGVRAPRRLPGPGPGRVSTRSRGLIRKGLDDQPTVRSTPDAWPLAGPRGGARRDPAAHEEIAEADPRAHRVRLLRPGRCVRPSVAVHPRGNCRHVDGGSSRLTPRACAARRTTSSSCHARAGATTRRRFRRSPSLLRAPLPAQAIALWHPLRVGREPASGPIGGRSHHRLSITIWRVPAKRPAVSR